MHYSLLLIDIINIKSCMHKIWPYGVRTWQENSDKIETMHVECIQEIFPVS